MSVFIARLYFPYGRGLSDRLLTDLVDRVRSRRPVLLHGADGMQVSPTHVDDVCRVLAKALDATWTGPMNVSAPETLSLRAVADLIGDALGATPVFAHDDRVSAAHFSPQLERLAAVMDVSSFRPFASGVRDLLDATTR